MKRIDWNALDERERAAVLQRPVQAVSDAVRSGVAAIFDAVAADGDAALRAYTQQFDGVMLEDFEVDAVEFEAARDQVPAAVQAAIAEAAGRIEAFHRAGIAAPYAVETAPGLRCERVQRPINRVGLYVPAGSAPLPSTALMLTIPARLAGCIEIILCTPPRKDGTADPAVLLAARQAPGVRVFKLGGAQAIAAMAYGTATIAPVDKITGPGNAYVAAAKRRVFGRVGIDMIAGPSEILVIGDGTGDADWIALDLLSQAEHDESAQAILITTCAVEADAVIAAVQARLETLERRDIAGASWRENGLVIVAQDLAEAAALSNRVAPEHLELCVDDPEALLPQIRHAGAVFLGHWTPEAVGDYVGGPNHVLPTARSARFSSGLSVLDFMKRTTLARMTPASLATIGPAAETLAISESLQAHGLSLRARLDRLNR